MSSNIPYISIKSVMHDVSTTIDEDFINEANILEWANKAFRQISSVTKYQECLELVEVLEHKAQLPSNLRHITQIAYKTALEIDELEELKRLMNLENSQDNPALPHMAFPEGLPTKALAVWATSYNLWYPMRMSTSSMFKSVLYNSDSNHIPIQSGDCLIPEYTVDPNLCLTTTLENGLIMVSYLGFAQDLDGDTLIPDNEFLKEALFHYCMYRYWMTKSSIKEQGAGRERDWHKREWEVKRIKAAGDLNMPSVDQLDNVMRQRNNLLPRSGSYSNFFSDLNKRENLKYL